MRRVLAQKIFSTNALCARLCPRTGFLSLRPQVPSPSETPGAVSQVHSPPELFPSSSERRVTPCVGACARRQRCERSRWISNLINMLIRMLAYFVTGQEKRIDFQKRVEGSIDWTIFPAKSGPASFPWVSSSDSPPTRMFPQWPHSAFPKSALLLCTFLNILGGVTYQTKILPLPLKKVPILNFVLKKKKIPPGGTSINLPKVFFIPANPDGLKARHTGKFTVINNSPSLWYKL